MKALILLGETTKMRAAIYLRVSTTDQSTSQQERELRAAAERMGHEVVEVYEDFGISGGKGREKRPAFDRLHQDAARRNFEIIMAWSVDRLGRSLQDLVAFLEHICACDIGLFLHQQGLDTTTPSGRAMFGMLGVFAEFERSIIRERVKSGMARAKVTGTKSGKAIGRPRLDPVRREAIRTAHQAGGIGLRGVARRFGVGVETVRRILAE
jgi:DNA invertase Pin-like site-specific DNA recombinase